MTDIRVLKGDGKRAEDVTGELHRYMAEFDFRYSNRAALDVTDTMRADIALNQIVGKRLLYRDSLGA